MMINIMIVINYNDIRYVDNLHKISCWKEKRRKTRPKKKKKLKLIITIAVLIMMMTIRLIVTCSPAWWTQETTLSHSTSVPRLDHPSKTPPSNCSHARQPPPPSPNPAIKRETLKLIFVIIWDNGLNFLMIITYPLLFAGQVMRFWERRGCDVRR